MIVFPNAKINLGLRIVRKRPDGYHDLESAFLPVGLTDVLEIIPVTRDKTGLSNRINVTGIPLPSTDDNLCLQAARLLQERHRIPYINIHLHKKIPPGAGLGGGSSDAAFTLMALNEKFGLNLDKPILMDYAAMIGSDCPFFVINSPSLVTGRGEHMKPLSIDIKGYIIVIVLPGIPVDTAMAYKMVQPDDMSLAVEEVLRLSPEAWENGLVNHFEFPVFEKYPELGRIKNVLYASGAIYASMSGSGSSVFGLFRDMPNLPAEICQYPMHIERFI